MLQLKNAPGFARNNLVMTHPQHKQIGQHRALVPFDVIRSCIIVLDVTAMEGHDLS
jgi:hypothetical protein